MGQTVIVKSGPWKGYAGIVKNTTDTTARVELHSKSKVINIARDRLLIREQGLARVTGDTGMPGSVPVGMTPKHPGIRDYSLDATPGFNPSTPSTSGLGSSGGYSAATPGLAGSVWDPTVANTAATPGTAAPGTSYDYNSWNTPMDAPTPGTTNTPFPETPANMQTPAEPGTVEQQMVDYEAPTPAHEQQAAPRSQWWEYPRLARLDLAQGVLIRIVVGAWDGTEGAVQQVEDDQVTVVLTLTKETLAFPLVHTVLVPLPEDVDQTDDTRLVRVIAGDENLGVVGRLVSRHFNDAIVQPVDDSDQFLAPISNLAFYQPQ